MRKQLLGVIFKNLTKDNYQITSPDTVDYNCIAWAAEDDDTWWWPDSNNLYYWPPGIPRQTNVAAFIEAFKSLGYEVCDNADFEDDFNKIAIYVDSNGIPTHAARQLISGKWTSKLGNYEDIEHNNLDNLPEYGTAVIFMKRPIYKS